MNPDFNTAFPRMPRGAPYEAARAQRRLKRTEQLLRTSRPLWSGLDSARSSEPDADAERTDDDNVCAEVAAAAAEHAAAQPASPFDQALSPAPSRFERQRSDPPSRPARFAGPRPPAPFDIKSENDLAVVIDALRERQLSPTAKPTDAPLLRTKKSPPAPNEQRRPPRALPVEPANPQNAAIRPVPRPHRTKPRQGRQKTWIAAAMMVLAFATGIAARDDLVSFVSWIETGVSDLASSISSVVSLTGQKFDQAASSLVRPMATPATSRGVTLSIAPDTYGLYALADGHLTRLEPLRNRVPDTTIALPGVITTPSVNTLADGHLSFVAFQRDLITSAPDRATIRVVAKLSRILSFTPEGTPRVSVPAEDSWATRAVSMDLTVAPVADNPEMVVLRPANPDTALAPGRYMLVFKNTAYDFSVQGQVTSRAHCVERTETQSGPVYSECRGPV